MRAQKDSGRNQPGRKRRRAAQCSGQSRSERNGEEQRERKKQRRRSEERRASGMNSSNEMGFTSADLGGRGKRWKVKDAMCQAQQKAVEIFGNMLSSPAGRWLRWRLYEGRSKVLYCHCRGGQPCHGDVVVRVFAEAQSEEEQRGGALPPFEGLSLCEVGWALKSHLCLSPRGRGLAMHEMLKRCSTLSRGGEFRNLVPFPLLPEPTNAEMELSMTCAHGEPVSPELMHEAAVDDCAL